MVYYIYSYIYHVWYSLSLCRFYFPFGIIFCQSKELPLTFFVVQAVAIKFVNFYWSENILPPFEDFIFGYKIRGWQSFSLQSTLLSYNWHYKKLYIFSIHNLMRQFLSFQHFRDAIPLSSAFYYFNENSPIILIFGFLVAFNFSPCYCFGNLFIMHLGVIFFVIIMTEIS